jgi:hypothetical protein
MIGASNENIRDVRPTSNSTLVLIVIEASLPAGTLQLINESEIHRLGLQVVSVNFNFGVVSKLPKLAPNTETITLPFLGEFAASTPVAIGTT